MSGIALCFSLFAGIAIGMAVRASVKIAMLISGIIIAAMMFFQYNGWIQADWASVSESFNNGLEASIPALEAFFNFAKEQLPKTALFVVGFYWAIKRRKA